MNFASSMTFARFGHTFGRTGTDRAAGNCGHPPVILIYRAQNYNDIGKPVSFITSIEINLVLTIPHSWRCIKWDFLHHFYKPRLDLLVWILIIKLARSYYRKLDQMVDDTGRYRKLPSWRKAFKRAWKKAAKTPITMPLNDKYRPNIQKWVSRPCNFSTLNPSNWYEGEVTQAQQLLGVL